MDILLMTYPSTIGNGRSFVSRQHFPKTLFLEYTFDCFFNLD